MSWHFAMLNNLLHKRQSGCCRACGFWQSTHMCWTAWKPITGLQALGSYAMGSGGHQVLAVCSYQGMRHCSPDELCQHQWSF